MNKERERLQQDRNHEKYWKRWGPYLSERAWATVREDYSQNGDAWSDFPFEQANKRVFRWGEDGLFGCSDNKQLICFNVAMWNNKDSIIKERLFGCTGPQGNHGEDVKELYFYLDNLPSHSYMKSIYKYPFSKPFPYEKVVEENCKRGYQDREFEIFDVDGLFQDDEGDTPYFDVLFEMAKDDENPEELNFRITAYNRSDKLSGELYLMPQVLFRNTWSWCEEGKNATKKKRPLISKIDDHCVKVCEPSKFGERFVYFAPSSGQFGDTEEPNYSNYENFVDDIEPTFLFTNNESNLKKLFGDKETNASPYTKDAFNEYLVNGDKTACNFESMQGTKCCATYHFPSIPPGDYVTVRYRFTNRDYLEASRDTCPFDEEEFDDLFEKKEEESNIFYEGVTSKNIDPSLRLVQRQAFAGLLWSKQFYHLIQEYWSLGDPEAKTKPPPNRANGRNTDWKHMYAEDILSLPDKWEYPFFASWDSSFHCIPLALIDPEFAKKQLDVLTREWYMHPNGQIPAYEWNFSDVNPPVHAWAAYRVFKIERNMYGTPDRVFLERVFQKLLLNFTWWVNRKDAFGKNVFEGGFLGLDNIGVFNRSEPLPTGGTLEQADSTGWMAFFSLQMLNIALELAMENPVYEDIASKFFEHFVFISDALSWEYMDDRGNVKVGSLWNEKDQFFYDAISYGDNVKQQLTVRSLVGLIPLYACLTLEPQILDRFPNFKKRLEWFVDNKGPMFERNTASVSRRGVGERLLLSLVSKEKLEAILKRMLDPNEFFSPYGIRSLSKYHKDHPYSINVGGTVYTISYLPGESDSGMFGGNSNWRGPIWFPTNFLIVESLQRFFLYYGSDFKVECPTGSGQYLNLVQVAQEIEHRLMKLFLYDGNGVRVCYEDQKHGAFLSNDLFFQECIPFFEYFDGDTGRGLGASHQCGWTALVAKFIHDNGSSCVVLDSATLSPTSTNTSSKGEYNVHFHKRTAFRRRSSKSLVSLAVSQLDLSVEEGKIHKNLSYKSSKEIHTKSSD
ncbi:related to glucosidase I [Saccharomycodes ludwigii]|uniref:Mannosyl-oligosaccharide glucosidase n=1 Tax=Saccharomycodes ludwigii TaxID=36035 RepID=A0A376B9V6_9ASCO|nr:related to glucosidase I [Saccharomycodes ludwigii]